MKRFLTTLKMAALVAAVLTLPLAAQERGPVGLADRVGGHAHGLLRCLRNVDLTDSQKADIKAILDAAKPTVEADLAAIKAARQQLNTDYTNGAATSVIGQDYINLRTAVKKLQDDGSATKNLVLGKLTPDQVTKVQACLDAMPGPHGMMFHNTTE
jgi:Spy/CpxP family protein refolding chaperone